MRPGRTDAARWQISNCQQLIKIAMLTGTIVKKNT
jgi:hypothetical protein